ncbi:MarR family winged helix-turn-helix transcriptional regulator [Cohnella sp. REN36]|uniref:MarR family winged helix-turn-helix transcriptional regulator n=1 Tax=Cohnella sp. REN36 TaxID=2887347 RepID=UPI001D15C43B|nr:MarR family winged helix-turn-helix transcriptional regulator [Cohnella sp. REN36]MCC3376276.1 MarR family winged helix-turn-helix transcriptional regulator [Cohnella sp. REN36]
MTDIQQYVTRQPLEVETFFAMVDATAALVGVSERYWHSQGLNGARIRILVEIAKAGGAILPTDLAARIGVTKPNVSVLLAPLEEAGYIRSSSHPDDGRKRRIQLTTEGERLLFEKLPGSRAVVSGRMDRLSQAELRQLRELCAKLRGEDE